MTPDQSDHDGWNLIVTPWHLDQPLSGFATPVSATRVGASELLTGAVSARMNRLHQAAADAIRLVKKPLVLSGDCPTARATVAAVQQRHDELAIVWIDAHGDFNTPEISTSGYIGGMAMAMLTGLTPELFDDGLGLKPIPDANVVLADARDLDPAERNALTDSRVHRVPADPDAIAQALTDIGPHPVYLHLDIDVIDAAELSGARFPSGPGPSITQVEECLSRVCAGSDVVAAYIACAWLPEHIDDQGTRETITRLVKALGADLVWP